MKKTPKETRLHPNEASLSPKLYLFMVWIKASKNSGKSSVDATAITGYEILLLIMVVDFHLKGFST